ncbi:MAG TPA: FHA domain-containing serine/threonine-protein kinase [Ktedonobacteraceae bacterium]|nr:FHA domain-containing serine/threonine-protein kinase [Ktedonobacteraceae bacterium]
MPMLEESQKFERYRITRWLGNGISGESYEAIDTMLQRKVTLKLIHPWTTLPDSARRQFFRELQGISLLNHVYLAPILDYGELDGRLYVVRRYVSSGSLLSNEGRLWFKPPFEVADAIQYAYQLAQALEYIHEQGYLHGALTLTNILVLRGANIDHEAGFAPFLLADIGLANFVRRFGQPLMPLLPITAAPEQLGKRVTPASDQFALAVLLYFWLAGRPPYLGTPEEVEQQKLSENFPPLSSLNSQITLEQEMVLHRTLSVYPDERYPSVLDFAEALMATLVSPSRGMSIADQTSQPETIFKLEAIPETDPALFSEVELVPYSDLPLSFEETLELLHQPTPPEPLPQPAPDIAQPLPSVEPVPVPRPEPETPAKPEPASQQEESEAARPASPIAPRLVISLPGYAEPSEFLLEREETLLGHAGSDDILLDQDASTSRHHALLKHEENRYILYDQRSTNGVYVNGQKLASDTGCILADEDRITIGSYELTFRSA